MKGEKFLFLQKTLFIWEELPEDDPRNPAVIADNVGDNVGDVAGMGADLFESYVGALVSALTLGVAVVGTFNGAGALFPLILAAAGIVASIIGCFFVRGDENSNPHKALKMGSYVSSAIVVVLSLVLSNVFFGGMAQAIAIIAGLTGADNAQQRTAGFEEELAKYPDIEIVATQYCDWDTQKAQAAAEDIITANPDLKAFLVQDDGMSKGVWNAIEAAGKQDQIIIASQGFYEWSIPYLKEGKFAFTITYPAGFFARDAMNIIKSVSDGETVERVQWLGMELVTAENADTAAHD